MQVFFLVLLHHETPFLHDLCWLQTGGIELKELPPPDFYILEFANTDSRMVVLCLSNRVISLVDYFSFGICMYVYTEFIVTTCTYISTAQGWKMFERI